MTCTSCDNGKYDVGANKIDVIVATPPGKNLLVMGLLYRDFIKVEAVLHPRQTCPVVLSPEYVIEQCCFDSTPLQWSNSQFYFKV